MSHIAATLLVSTLPLLVVASQQPPTATFDVVSIKRSNADALGGSARTTPDGTTVLVNQPIRSILTRGASEPVREIENLPDWAMDLYDITAKPPEGATRASIPEMWRNLLAERLKMKAHIEHRDKDGFALVVARADGRLGPNLKPSTLDCSARPQTGPPPQPFSLPSRQEAAGLCGMLGGQGYVVSGGMDMQRLALLASGWVDRAPVTDRTGLKGYYALELTYSVRRLSAASPDAADPSGLPDPLTALQEQLGLKLQREKITIAVLVIDHIEPPAEN